MERFGIHAVPAVLAYVDGVVVRSLVGMQPDAKVSHFITRVVACHDGTDVARNKCERETKDLLLSLTMEQADERKNSWYERVRIECAAAEATKLAMEADEFQVVLSRLGLTAQTAAEFLGVDARTLRRYAVGRIPKPVARLLRLMTRLGEKPHYSCAEKAMTCSEYRFGLDRFGLSAAKAGDIVLGISSGMSQRYAAGNAEVPEVIAKILRLIVARRLSLSDIADLTSIPVTLEPERPLR
jgi:hypothetical protein